MVSREEIVNAVKISNKVKNNIISIDSIDDSIINEHLYTQNLPVDLLIRTSGEHRISNCLWQIAYAEYILLMYCGQTLRAKFI
jgi:undecaprenyl diphosphate synthase